jgi:hypothetical protein
MTDRAAEPSPCRRISLAALSPADEVSLALALRDYGRALRRNGGYLSPQLAELATALLERNGDRNAADRDRLQAAVRMRRYRARKRAEAAQQAGDRLAG